MSAQPLSNPESKVQVFRASRTDLVAARIQAFHASRRLRSSLLGTSLLYIRVLERALVLLQKRHAAVTLKPFSEKERDSLMKSAMKIEMPDFIESGEDDGADDEDAQAEVDENDDDDGDEIQGAGEGDVEDDQGEETPRF